MSVLMSAHQSFDVAGRVALVTGSSRGIGYALATGLAEAGAVVVLNGRDTVALERSRVEIADKTGAVVHACAFDATDSAQVAAAAHQVEDLSAVAAVLERHPHVSVMCDEIIFTDEPAPSLLSGS
jgi:short-subunit dehydrogenase